MKKQVKSFARLMALSAFCVACTQPKQDKKATDKLAVEKAHKGIIAKAIENDLSTLKNLRPGNSGDENLLSFLKMHNQLSVSLTVFLLKSAPDAAMQEFALRHIQNVRGFSERLKAVDALGDANLAVEHQAFDVAKNGALKHLSNLKSENNVQQDYLKYMRKNAELEVGLIKSYRDKVQSGPLKKLANDIAAYDEKVLKQLSNLKPILKAR